MITGPADEPQLHPARAGSPPTCPTAGRRRCCAVCDIVEAGIAEYDALLTENPIWLERMVGVGVITTEQALSLGVTGPILRSTGFAWDLRTAQPYLAYDEVDFDVIYTENGDCFDRYRIRLYEIAESIKIVRQCVEKMPRGDYRVQDKKVTPPPRARINESMEALIHHFKLFTEGFRVPAGETYVVDRVAARRDRLLPRRRRHREAGPPAHPRSVLLQPRRDGADDGGPAGRRRGRGDLERRPDHGRGRPVSVRCRSRRRTVRQARRDRGEVPVRRARPCSRCCTSRRSRTVGSRPTRSRRSPGSSGSSPRRCSGRAASTRCTSATGRSTSSCPCARTCRASSTAGPSCYEALSERYARRDDVEVEEVECLAACDTAPVFQVNYEFHGNATDESAAATIEEYRSGARVPRGVSGGKRA